MDSSLVLPNLAEIASDGQPWCNVVLNVKSLNSAGIGLVERILR